jgi:hypothetical protein
MRMRVPPPAMSVVGPPPPKPDIFQVVPEIESDRKR